MDGSVTSPPGEATSNERENQEDTYDQEDNSDDSCNHEGNNLLITLQKMSLLKNQTQFFQQDEIRLTDFKQALDRRRWKK